MSYFEGKVGVNNNMWVVLYYNRWRGRLMHKEMSCFIPPKKSPFDPSHSLGETSGVLVWFVRWERLNSWEPLRNHSRRATQCLECVNCPMFLTTWHWIPWNLDTVQMLIWTIDASIKGCFNVNTIRVTFTVINVVDGHAKFALEWQWWTRIHTLTWAPSTTKTWPLPTFTFISTF